MLKKICQELVTIKREPQAIRKSVKFKNESPCTHDYHYVPFEKAMLNTLNQPSKLNKNSVARLVQTDSQEGKIKDKEELEKLTSWANIQATNQKTEPPVQGEYAVVGISYTKLNDFASAGILTKHGAKVVWKQKTWVCTNSVDLPHIKYPLRELGATKELEFVDAPEIPADLIVDWIAEQMRIYSIQMTCIDNYSYAPLKNALEKLGISYENKNIKLVRPSDRIRVEPIIDRGFRNHNIAYGNSSLMRWYTNNTQKVKSGKYGNYEYQKNEEKSRKTEGFFAFVDAMTQVDILQETYEERKAEKEKIYKTASEFVIRIMEKQNQTAQELAALPQLLEILLKK